MKCKDCDWWKLIKEGAPLNGAEKGRCRRRAPTVTAVVMPKVNQIANTVTPQIIEVTGWPVTGAECEACGDFKNKETGGYGSIGCNFVKDFKKAVIKKKGTKNDL